MELRRLRELLSLEKRVLVGESGPGVQSPNKLASSSSSRALSFTSPGSRGQGGALFNSISELLQADTAYDSAELPRSAAGRSAWLLFSSQPKPPAEPSSWPGLLPFHPTVGLSNVSLSTSHPMFPAIWDSTAALPQNAARFLPRQPIRRGGLGLFLSPL